MDQSSFSDVFQTEGSVKDARNNASEASLRCSSRMLEAADTIQPYETAPYKSKEPEPVNLKLGLAKLPEEPAVQAAIHAHVSPRYEHVEIKSENVPSNSPLWQPPPMLSPWELCRKVPPPASFDGIAYTPEGGHPYWVPSKYQECLDPKTHPGELVQGVESSYFGERSYAPYASNYAPVASEVPEDYALSAEVLAMSDMGGQRAVYYNAVEWDWQHCAPPVNAPELSLQNPENLELRNATNAMPVGVPDYKSSEVQPKVSKARPRARKTAEANCKEGSGRVRKPRVSRRKRFTSCQSPLVSEPELITGQLKTPPVSDEAGASPEDVKIPQPDTRASSRMAKKTAGGPGSPRRGRVDTTTAETTSRPRFSMEEEYVMTRLRDEGMSWAHIASMLPVRGPRSLQVHYSSVLARQFGEWTNELDMVLVSLVNQHERDMWDIIAKMFHDPRIKGIACRNRYTQLHDFQMRQIDKWIAETREQRRR